MSSCTLIAFDKVVTHSSESGTGGEPNDHTLSKCATFGIEKPGTRSLCHTDSLRLSVLFIFTFLLLTTFLTDFTNNIECLISYSFLQSRLDFLQVSTKESDLAAPSIKNDLASLPPPESCERQPVASSLPASEDGPENARTTGFRQQTGALSILSQCQDPQVVKCIHLAVL